MLGEIENLNGAKQSIAVINQIRTIDKRRLFDQDTIARLYSLLSNEIIGEYKETTVQLKRWYRLTEEQYNKMHRAVEDYVYNGFIKH